MRRYIAFILSLILILSFTACGTKEKASAKEPESSSSTASEPSAQAAPEGEQSSEEASPPEGASGSQDEAAALAADLREESFVVRGNNAQPAQVVITIPESWWASNIETLSSRSGWAAKFESVTTAPTDREAYFRGKEAEYGQIVASGDLESLGLDGRYCHFLLELFDGTKEDRVQYFIFDDVSVAEILLIPFPDLDVGAQREELESFLGTMRFGPLDPETPAASGGEQAETRENQLWFSLGPEGEMQALGAGDTLGGWTLQSCNVDWDRGEFDGTPWVNQAVFTAPADAPVELSCTVSLDTMSLPDRYYSFFVDDEDIDKLPVLKEDGRSVWFTGNNSASLTALADLGNDETRSCRAAISKYTYVCIPMMSSNGADIVWVELE